MPNRSLIFRALGLNLLGDKMRLRERAVKKVLITVVIMIFSLIPAFPVMGGEPKVIGVWDNSNSRENYKIIIAEDGDETVLIKKFKDGIRIRQVVIAAKGSEGMVYNSEDENKEEFYIIDQNGNLQVWTVFGLQATLEPDN